MLGPFASSINFMFDLVSGMPDDIEDPTAPGVFERDNVQGFTPAMSFGALDNSIDIQSFGQELSSENLSNTTTTLTNFENLVDVYDVFN